MTTLHADTFDVRLPTNEALVVLAWGDGVITTCTDTGDWITSGFPTIPPLQRALMATRLRFLLDAVLEAEPGGRPT